VAESFEEQGDDTRGAPATQARDCTSSVAVFASSENGGERGIRRLGNPRFISLSRYLSASYCICKMCGSADKCSKNTLNWQTYGKCKRELNVATKDRIGQYYAESLDKSTLHLRVSRQETILERIVQNVDSCEYKPTFCNLQTVRIRIH
jgi:hypothetical protein